MEEDTEEVDMAAAVMEEVMDVGVSAAEKQPL